MYFLRRRHGRKSQPDARRQPAPAQAPEASHEASHAAPNHHQHSEPAYPEMEQPEPVRPVVITKPKRPRVTPAADDDVKPAGTFRSGTLHIHGNRREPQHGKL